MSASQARLGFAIGGAVIGGYFGVPGLGLAVGSIAGSLLFPGPDPPPTLGPRIGDLQTQVSSYGNPIPWIFGTDRVAGNIIWNSEIREVFNTQSQSGGGKGGGPPKPEIGSFEYRVDLCISLCKGPIQGIKKVWANDQLYYDFTDCPHGRGINSKLYLGTETQLPDPLMEADKGVGNVPGYRGQAYIMLRNLALNQFNGGIPILHFEVINDGDPLIPIVEVLDSTNGLLGRVTFDEETGLIYHSRSGTDLIEVFSCKAGLSKLCSVSHVAPYFLSWSPRFIQIQVSLLGDVTKQQIPSQMWVGSHAPDGSANTSLVSISTDGSCRILSENQSPLGGSFLCWPGMVFVDRHSINENAPNFGGGAYLISGTTNGACFYQAPWPIGPGDTAGGLGPTPSINNPAIIAGVEHTADIVLGTAPFFYGIDWDGRVWRGVGGSESFSIDTVVEATASFANLGNSVTYDPDEEMVYTHSTIFGGTSRLKKWDKSLNLIWEFETNYSGDNGYEPVRVRYHAGVGDVWTVGRDSTGFIQTKQVDKQNGGWEVEFTLASSRTLHDFQPFPGAPFAIGSISSTPGGIMKFPLGPGAILDPPTLASVVTRLVEGSDTLTAADINVTSIIADTVRGYNIAARMPIRNALQPLLNAYFVDVMESDYKIKFVKRGNASVMTVPVEDLSAHRGGASETPDPVLSERTQENELPDRLDVRFKNANTDYKIGTATTKRLRGESQQLRTVDYPIVFTPTECKAIADVVIFNTWFERVKKSVAVSRKYLRLDPTDVITIPDPDVGPINIRINSVSFSIPGLLLFNGSEEDDSIYSGFTFPAPEGRQPQPGILDSPPVVLAVLDISQLRDIDDNSGVYVVGYAIGGAFSFAEVQFSQAGQVYTPKTVISNEGAVAFANNSLTWEGSFS